MLDQIRKDIQKEGDKKKAVFLARFFKTGKGEYAEGDIFLGLTVPQSRKIVVQYKDLPLSDCIKLLQSKIHEERLIALLILVSHFAKASRDKSQDKQKEIFDLYLANTKFINNWDLVDLSAAQIVGGYLLDEIASPSARNDVLIKLANSKDLWEKRIAMVATFAFIRKGNFETTFRIADILLEGMTASNAASATYKVASHDLIHKAVGWMLREAGKRISEKELEKYLKPRYKKMPRTMLRYAIERFEEGKRKKYLAGFI